MIPFRLPHSIYWDRSVNAYNLGGNTNHQGGNKMIFAVTRCNPEESINRAPNSPSILARIDFVVGKYGKDTLRRYFTHKKFSTEQGKKMEGNQRSVQGAWSCGPKKSFPLQKRREGCSGLRSGTPPAGAPRRCHTYHFQISKQLIRHDMSMFPTEGDLATDISRKHKAVCQRVNQLHHLREPLHVSPRAWGNNLMWKKSPYQNGEIGGHHWNKATVREALRIKLFSPLQPAGNHNPHP